MPTKEEKVNKFLKGYPSLYFTEDDLKENVLLSNNVPYKNYKDVLNNFKKIEKGYKNPYYDLESILKKEKPYICELDKEINVDVPNYKKIDNTLYLYINWKELGNKLVEDIKADNLNKEYMDTLLNLNSIVNRLKEAYNSNDENDKKARSLFFIFSKIIKTYAYDSRININKLNNTIKKAFYKWYFNENKPSFLPTEEVSNLNDLELEEYANKFFNAFKTLFNKRLESLDNMGNDDMRYQGIAYLKEKKQKKQIEEVSVSQKVVELVNREYIQLISVEKDKTKAFLQLLDKIKEFPPKINDDFSSLYFFYKEEDIQKTFKEVYDGLNELFKSFKKEEDIKNKFNDYNDSSLNLLKNIFLELPSYLERNIILLDVEYNNKIKSLTDELAQEIVNKIIGNSNIEDNIINSVKEKLNENRKKTKDDLNSILNNLGNLNNIL